MKKCKRPDLNAPRFRSKKTNLLNKDLYKNFIEKNPKYNYLSYGDFKKIIQCFNGNIWKTVIENRDGVELPESLGYLFLASCTHKKKYNIDFKKSSELGYVVQHKNWESDNYLGKIIYSNCEGKYKFANHNLWSFSGVRNFTRTVAREYPKNWKTYHMLTDRTLNSSKTLFRKKIVKDYFLKKTEVELNNYNEFDFS